MDGWRTFDEADRRQDQKERRNGRSRDARAAPARAGIKRVLMMIRTPGCNESTHTRTFGEAFASAGTPAAVGCN